MSYGLPAIVWHESAGPELVGDDIGGLVLKDWSEDAIVHAIQELKQDHKFFGMQAKNRADHMLNIITIAKQYADVFKELANV
jgi:glycosyltransferase involved in cell wall biosynthesis